jgi:hypothetical protein
MKKMLFTALAALLALSACHKYDDESWKNSIEDRLTTLEDAVAALEDRLESGVLIKSVTPITEAPGGWRIEFTGGTPSTIDIMNGKPGESMPDPGADGVTPLIEVRTNPDGTVSVWYNVTAGYPESGWVNTCTDIRGPQGPQGIPGTPGDPGTPGTPGSPGNPGSSTDSPIVSVVDNQAEGTVTINVNGGKSYTFPKASGVVRMELFGFSDKVTIPEGSASQIRFRVNPSNAWVPTGGDQIANWQLDQMETRASYVTAPDNFALSNILPDGEKQGQYIAWIECTGNDADIEDYAMALVLNTGAGTAASPGLVTSPTFVLGTGEPLPLTFTDSPTYDIPPTELNSGPIYTIGVYGGVSGGKRPYTFSATGFPAGLAIDPDLGNIYGTPTEEMEATETDEITITVTDALGATASIGINCEIKPEPYIIATPGEYLELPSTETDENFMNPDETRVQFTGFYPLTVESNVTWYARIQIESGEQADWLTFDGDTDETGSVTGNGSLVLQTKRHRIPAPTYADYVPFTREATVYFHNAEAPYYILETVKVTQDSEYEIN